MIKRKTNSMLPGFHVTIEDDIQKVQEAINLKDLILIYAVMPEQMKSYNEDGELEPYYLEPNKLMLISSPEEAIETLSITDLPLTREVQNIIRLIPNGANIGIVRIVKRNGESPNTSSLSEMYEALDHAFEETEQVPAKQIICAGISLDDMVAVDSTEILKETTSNGENTDSLKLSNILTDVKPYGTIDEITDIKQFTVAIQAGRCAESLKTTQTQDCMFNTYRFMINGQLAKMVAVDSSEEIGTKVDATVTAVLEYGGESNGEKTVTVTSSKAGNTNPDEHATADTLLKIATADDNGMSTNINGDKTKNVKLQVLKPVRLFVEDNVVLELKAGEFLIDAKKPDEADEYHDISSVYVTKLPDSASLLRRYLLHVHKITSYQNNAFAYLSPKPPKSLSNRDVEAYKERCGAIYEKIREQCKYVSGKGNALDLGRYLTVPVGVNSFDGIGGLTGFPQARVSTIETNNKVITKKVTSSFKKGDIVEVYSHDKMEILVHTTRVKSITVSKVNTTEVHLVDNVPETITRSRNPIYIMNVNNKDFNGTYLAQQWANVCARANVDRSPAGLTWQGECQLRWTQKQLDYLDSRKFAVLQQSHGQTVGSVSRSQLMTAPGTNRYQKWESMKVAYTIIEGAKDIAMKYKGQRIDDGVDLALIRTEIEDGVFKPAVGRYITPTYEIKLQLKKLKNPNKLEEKAMWIYFSCVEIETLELIRMGIRLN